MGDSMTIRIFTWNDRAHVTVDRIGEAGARKHARRTRLVSWSADRVDDLTEAEMALAASVLLFDWALPKTALSGALAPPAPPWGGHGGERANGAPTGPQAPSTLASENRAPRYMRSGAEGVSDGLEPPGETPPLW